MADQPTSARKRKWQSFLIANGLHLMVLAALFQLLGKLHWIPDVLASFLVHFVVGLLLIGLLLFLSGRRRWGLAHFVAALALGWPIGGYLPLPFLRANGDSGSEETYKAIVFNVHYHNERHKDVADYLTDQQADFVLLLETNKRWVEEMDFELQDQYRHRWSQPRDDAFGLMLLSRHPWDEVHLRSFSDKPSVEATFTLAGRKLRLIGTHPVPPMSSAGSAERNSHLEKLAAHCAGGDKDAALLVVGDFNCTPWSPWFRSFARQAGLRDSAKGRGLQPTWYAYPTVLTGIPIDHAFLGPSVTARSRLIGPNLGSDHRPLVVEFGFR